MIPLAPSRPYTAVAEASFKTEKLSISFGSTSSIVLFNPSIKIRGSLFPVTELIPLIIKEAPSFPGCPDFCTKVTPATLPANWVDNDRVGAFNSLGSRVVIAPTILTFF